MKRANATCNQPGCTGIPVYRGKCLSHAQWNGNPKRTRGRTLMTRRARLIRQRGNRCQRCNSRSPLELHHVDGNPANDHDHNLQLLCHRCHHQATQDQRNP